MTIEAIVARYGVAAVFLGAGIEGETAVVTGGLLAHRGLIDPVATFAAAAAGSFVADQAFFAAGRRFRGAAWVRRMHARPAFARALAALKRHPTGFILAFRFLYGLRTVSPVAVGTSGVATRTFVTLNAVAAIVWAAIFTTIGWVFGQGLTELLGRYRPHGREWLWVAAAVALVGAGVGLWRGRRME